MSDTENPTPSSGSGPDGGAQAKKPAAKGRGASRKGRGGAKGKAATKRKAQAAATEAKVHARKVGTLEKLAAKGTVQTELTPGLIQEFVHLIEEESASIPDACNLLGISEDACKAWRRQGEEHKRDNRPHTLPAQFATLVRRARSKLRTDLKSTLTRLARGEDVKGNFSQLVILLELLFPEMHTEVRSHIAEMNAEARARLKKALPPEMYDKAVDALTGED